MPAFTKGKWSYADVSTPYEQHFIIGTVDKTGTFYAHASTKTEADARLFAAAPDMYNFLVNLYGMIHIPGVKALLDRIDGSEDHAHDTDA